MRFRATALVLLRLIVLAVPAAASAQESRPYGEPKPFPYAFTPSAPPVAELKDRRAKLAAKIRDGVVVALSQEAPSLYSGARYKPANTIYYLTGVETDFCALVLVAKDGKILTETLFLPKRDAQYELWNGRRVVADGPEATRLTGVEEVVAVQGSLFGSSLKPLQKALEALVETAPGPFYTEGTPPKKPRLDEVAPLELGQTTRADALVAWLADRKRDLSFRSLAAALNAQRGIKSAWEIAQIRAACDATGEGFVRGLRRVRPGMWEFEFDAIMQHAFIDLGCTGLPYYPISASGPNACVLHYTDNKRQYQDGDVVLCDIAAEWGWYAADVTRSFPANGKFTPRQRQVYEAVLAGQAAAAAALKPGVNFGKLDAICRKAMSAAGLKDHEQHPHGLSHHVGLAVHDPGEGVMKPGMVITIEPGSYLKDEALGIRIEDCYLVTEDGSECLSARIPKSVEAIEAIVGADVRAK